MFSFDSAFGVYWLPTAGTHVTVAARRRHHSYSHSGTAARAAGSSSVVQASSAIPWWCSGHAASHIGPLLHPIKGNLACALWGR